MSEITNGYTARDKLANMMGDNRPDAFESVQRDKFESEDAYLDAVTAEKLKRSTPEYQSARREVEREWRQRQEQEQRERQREAYSEAYNNVRLSDLDRRNIDDRAAELARRDLSAGRIGTRDMGVAIEEHAKKLMEERRKELASNAVMNAMFRQK